MSELQTPEIRPSRDRAAPESYALYVSEPAVHVWQYRVGLSEREGEWHFVETLDRGDDPRVSVDYAVLEPPEENGYWLYSRSYDCRLDCE